MSVLIEVRRALAVSKPDRRSDGQSSSLSNDLPESGRACLRDEMRLGEARRKAE